MITAIWIPVVLRGTPIGFWIAWAILLSFSGYSFSLAVYQNICRKGEHDDRRTIARSRSGFGCSYSPRLMRHPHVKTRRRGRHRLAKRHKKRTLRKLGKGHQQSPRKPIQAPTVAVPDQRAA